MVADLREGPSVLRGGQAFLPGPLDLTGGGRIVWMVLEVKEDGVVAVSHSPTTDIVTAN